MKKILLGTSVFLFLTGCSTIQQNSIFIQECNKLEKPFMDDSLSYIFDKEKNVKIDTNDSSSCTGTELCNKITKSDRWYNIRILLKGNQKIFPKEDGFYTVTRDYQFKNCIEKFAKYRNNNFEKDERNFCVSENKDNLSYQIEYKKQIIEIYRDENSSIFKTIDIVYVDNKIFLSNEGITANYKTGQKFCGLENKIYDKIRNNF